MFDACYLPVAQHKCYILQHSMAESLDLDGVLPVEGIPASSAPLRPWEALKLQSLNSLSATPHSDWILL